MVGIGLSGLLCVPCCWRCCWPKGQPLPFSNRAWPIYFSMLGFLLLWWATMPTLWFYYSPISTCSPLWMRSAPPDRVATSMAEWEGFWCTRHCGERELLHPTSVTEVSAALAGAASLRVVGSGHSATDVQCPDPGGIVVSIDGLCTQGHVNGTTMLATLSAGCTIRATQEWLMGQGYQLVGYGSILSQTIAGALATSLHGEFTGASFGDNLVGLKAVLADGSTRQLPVGDPEVHAWVGSMGELGVVVEATMRVLPTLRVVCETRRGSQADAMAALQDTSLTMVVVDTLIGAESGTGPFAIRTCREINSSHTGEPIVVDSLPDGTVGLFYETYGLSMLRLASTLPLVRGPIVGAFLLAAPHGPHEQNALDASFNSAKGIYNVYPHSEVAVPVEHCPTLLNRMRTEAERLGVAYILAIKIVPPSQAWRTWATNRSCTINIDFYDFGHGDSVTRDLEFRAFTEGLAVDQLGGGMHLGKMWVRPNRQQLLRNAPHAAEFEALRQSLDPTGKLQNEHTRATHGDGECSISPLPVELDTRSAVWRGFVWAGVGLSVVISLAACWTCARASSRREPTLLTKRKEEVCTVRSNSPFLNTPLRFPHNVHIPCSPVHSSRPKHIPHAPLSIWYQLSYMNDTVAQPTQEPNRPA